MSQDKAGYERLEKLLQGELSVPVITVDDHVMKGFNPAQLTEWLKE